MHVILTVYKKYLYKNCNLHCALYAFYKNSDLDFSIRCIKPPAPHYGGWHYHNTPFIWGFLGVVKPFQQIIVCIVTIKIKQHTEHEDTQRLKFSLNHVYIMRRFLYYNEICLNPKCHYEYI